LIHFATCKHLIHLFILKHFNHPDDFIFPHIQIISFKSQGVPPFRFARFFFNSTPLRANGHFDIQGSFSKAAGGQFNCLMGLACGPMVAGSAGYTRFRTMVCFEEIIYFIL